MSGQTTKKLDSMMNSYALCGIEHGGRGWMYLSVAQALDIEELQNGLMDLNMDSDVRNVGRTKVQDWLIIKTNVDAEQDTMESTHRTEVVQSAQRENIINGLVGHGLIAFSVPQDKRRAWDRPNVPIVFPARILRVLVYAVSVEKEDRRTGD